MIALLKAAAFAVASALFVACASSVHPQPSEAILEARARADRAEAPPPVPCGAMDFEHVEVVFPYAEATLLDEARAQLTRARDWMRCHESGRVRLVVETERHHRKPEFETELRRERTARAARFLHDQGAPAARIIDADVVGDSPVLLVRLRGRGW